VGILDKLINDLKSKVPFLNKKKDLESEESEIQDDDIDSRSVLSGDKTDAADISDIGDATQTDLSESQDEESKSIVDKLKKQFQQLTNKLSKKKAASGSDLDSSLDDENSTTSDEQAKKKKSLIIKVIVVALLAVILLYDEIFPPEPEMPQPVPTLQPRYKKKKPAENNVETKTEQPTAEPTVEQPKIEEPKVEETKNEEPTIDNSGVDFPQVEESATNLESSTISEPQVDSPIEQTTESTNQVNEGGFVDTTETNTPSSDIVDDTIIPSENVDFNDTVLKDLESQVNTTEVEIEQKEYVAPPDYEYLGRGLVYNCVGKHWACIDGASYKICKTNLAGNKYLKKNVECYPVNVYETQEGCEIVQNRMITSNEKTNFCQSN
jgi:hypothetical protein